MMLRKTFLRTWIVVGLLPATATHAQVLAPDAAAKRMIVHEGLTPTLYASEPDVRQPIFVKCDDRGRLWTIQYLQYPNPAGLERVKVDRWSRTVYDRVPEPPPHGPRGADRITIMEDSAGDGRADKFKDFIDGLNLVTGVEFGHGGLFVLNVPYLLFYPDANRDDVPDADPEVLLSGFGMEDAQAMSNHLTWGPDGWLYGVNGSTTTCNIRGIEFQQGLWRYHPVTREFELFCEGGSNCYGVTFDLSGECYYSTNGGPFVHAVQGGYFYKSFGKHGPLHNLYAYHFFPELHRDQVPGGPPTGGTMYLAGAFPEPLRGSFIAGNFLGHTASFWKVEPTGSTVRASYGGVLLDAHDPCFGATDVCAGPDGAMYLSDFYDQRTAHPDPDAQWDVSNGRIYKLSAKAAPAAEPFDLTAKSGDELVDLLSHRNHWFADRARVELARRRDLTVAPKLREIALQAEDSQLALEGLWALNAVAEIDDELALKLLIHPYHYIRYWVIRLTGDRKAASPALVDRFIELAATDDSPVVRSQLAATAKRLPSPACLRIVDSLLEHHPNEDDPRIPWLIWWAIEAKAISDADAVVEQFASDAAWNNPAARGNALRLIRRYAAEGAADGYAACLRLLESAPADHRHQAREHLRLGLAERAVGLTGIGQGELFAASASEKSTPQTATRRFEPAEGPLRQHIESLWRQDPQDLLGLELALRADITDAAPALEAAAFEPGVAPERRIALLNLLRDFGDQGAANALLKLIGSDEPEGVQLAAIDALGAVLEAESASALLSHYQKMPPALRARARGILLSRPESAVRFLQQLDANRLAAKDVPLDELRILASHKNEAIDELVRKHWGNIGPGTAEEKLATMRRYNNDLRPGGGEASRGKLLYAKHCGICHQLNGEGNTVGPDLTTANRQDLAALLTNIVDPSAVIRREYMNYLVATDSGQTYIGLLAEQDGASVTVLDAKNERIKIPRDEVLAIEESDVSLMPERILEPLTPDERRDLFAYLQDAPAN